MTFILFSLELSYLWRGYIKIYLKQSVIPLLRYKRIKIYHRVCSDSILECHCKTSLGIFISHYIIFLKISLTNQEKNARGYQLMCIQCNYSLSD